MSKIVFPNDVWSTIIWKFEDKKDLLTLALVCKKLNKVVKKNTKTMQKKYNSLYGLETIKCSYMELHYCFQSKRYYDDIFKSKSIDINEARRSIKYVITQFDKCIEITQKRWNPNNLKTLNDMQDRLLQLNTSNKLPS